MTCRSTTILGKGRAGSAIAAAKKLVKKAIFCVDNVKTSCTADVMRSFVANLSVDVLSCYEAKPRRRRSDTDEVIKDRKAFRVCIDQNHCQRFLDPNVWPESVVISEWYWSDKGKRQRVNNSQSGPSAGGDHSTRFDEVARHTSSASGPSMSVAASATAVEIAGDDPEAAADIAIADGDIVDESTTLNVDTITIVSACDINTVDGGQQ